jgi:hypothetical protein
MGWCWFFSIRGDKKRAASEPVVMGRRIVAMDVGESFDISRIFSPDCHWVRFVILREGMAG